MSDVIPTTEASEPQATDPTEAVTPVMPADHAPDLVEVANAPGDRKSVV